ncbi:hypothetical protein [Kitasatospora griseola]
MPEQYRVVDVSRISIGPGECWQIRQERPDGQHHLTVFPTAALEWRAAEYDIDHTSPDGIDLIIDMLLHEPFLTDDSPTAAVQDRGLGKSEPVTLHNAPDLAAARAAHLERIAHTKRTRVAVITGSTPEGRRGTAAAMPVSDPLDAIRTDHGITAEGVAAKSDLVQQARQQAARGGSPARPQLTSAPGPRVRDAAPLRRSQAPRRTQGTDTA